jgi:hypothetical protein
MRLVHAAALTAAALLLASVASAQGLGDAAAREREKRKAVPAKPAKVYTESDIGRSMAPVETTQDLPTTAAEAGAEPADGEPAGTQEAAEGEAGAEGQPAAGGEAGGEGQPAAEGEAPVEGGEPATDAGAKAAADAAAAENEAREKAVADWRKRLDKARKEEAVYKDIVDKLQLELNDISGGLYNPGRAAKIAFQEENKTLLAQAQGKIAMLEEEGRRNRY